MKLASDCSKLPLKQHRAAKQETPPSQDKHGCVTRSSIYQMWKSILHINHQKPELLHDMRFNFLINECKNVHFITWLINGDHLIDFYWVDVSLGCSGLVVDHRQTCDVLNSSSDASLQFHVHLSGHQAPVDKRKYDVHMWNMWMQGHRRFKVSPCGHWQFVCIHSGHIGYGNGTELTGNDCFLKSLVGISTNVFHPRGKDLKRYELWYIQMVPQ